MDAHDSVLGQATLAKRVICAGEALVGRAGLQAVLPMGPDWLWPWKQRTQVMAILNLTPDSFSDGGQVSS